ncbi:hypothetical protein EJ03DRAFT_349740 [Teratosphaeria nubilosa]|uniref:Uncharacterized protein n=1 Tax=Teratosphaeria nubilosa TaxID=161662 RepID=A0A6G1LFJ2_9PEZI|nr:hypothetical protein EJ03DRAFT_349740 [Teratosphaeria nubilosa]
MARARKTATTHDSGILSRLRHRKNTKVTTKESTNPITGTRTTTRTTKTQAHHGHSTGGPNTTATGTTHAHHKRKPSVGDKVSGAMMKLKGTITRKPGVKAAGTRRMHGTDGKGSHHAAAAARY